MAEPDPQVVALDARHVGADLDTVDALARLALSLRRHGRALRLDYAAPELLELIDLAGLSDVLLGYVQSRRGGSP